MQVAGVTFDGFNEIDAFVAAHILNWLILKGGRHSSPRRHVVTSRKRQLVAMQCSGALLLSKLGLLDGSLFAPI